VFSLKLRDFLFADAPQSATYDASNVAVNLHVPAQLHPQSHCLFHLSIVCLLPPVHCPLPTSTSAFLQSRPRSVPSPTLCRHRYVHGHTEYIGFTTRGRGANPYTPCVRAPLSYPRSLPRIKPYTFSPISRTPATQLSKALRLTSVTLYNVPGMAPHRRNITRGTLRHVYACAANPLPRRTHRISVCDCAWRRSGHRAGHARTYLGLRSTRRCRRRAGRDASAHHQPCIRLDAQTMRLFASRVRHTISYSPCALLPCVQGLTRRARLHLRPHRKTRPPPAAQCLSTLPSMRSAALPALENPKAPLWKIR
jgi:hypothetical protein